MGGGGGLVEEKDGGGGRVGGLVEERIREREGGWMGEKIVGR